MWNLRLSCPPYKNFLQCPFLEKKNLPAFFCKNLLKKLLDFPLSAFLLVLKKITDEATFVYYILFLCFDHSLLPKKYKAWYPAWLRKKRNFSWFYGLYSARQHHIY